jgi:hypothetical protein
VHDDPSILDDDSAYRRVIHSEAFIEWDSNRQSWLPTNAAVRDPGGGSEISVYLRSFLSSTRGAADVAGARPGCVAFAVNVGDARGLGFGLTHRPDQDDGPLRHAHGNINGDPVWPKQAYRAQRNELVRRMNLASGEISLPRST